MERNREKKSTSLKTSFINSVKFCVQVTDLRLALQRTEQQQARKEDYLREEISELQQVT